MTKTWVPSLAQKRLLLWLYVHDGDTFGSWVGDYERFRPGQVHETTLLILEKEGVIQPGNPRNHRILSNYGVYELTESGQRVVAALLADGLPTPHGPSPDTGSVRKVQGHGHPRLLNAAQEQALLHTGRFVHALNLPGSVRIPPGVRWKSFMILAARGMIDMRQQELQSTEKGLRDRGVYSDDPVFLMTTRGLSYYYGLTAQPAWLYRVWVVARDLPPVEHATGLDLRQAYDMVTRLNASRSQDGLLHAFHERI